MTGLPCFSSDPNGATALHLVERTDRAAWLDQHPAHAPWLAACDYRSDPGSYIVLPPSAGEPAAVLASPAEGESTWALGALPLALPEGCYALAEETPGAPAALGWALGAYQFGRYKTPRRTPAKLVWCNGAQRDEVEQVARAAYLARDLINTPAEDLGPGQLVDVARAIAGEYGATIEAHAGDALLAQGYPTIHLVGRSSPRPPALIDLRWGDPEAPRLTLVGKGVCFDTGGLDIKTHDGMLEMKKDMGGAAVVLGLAQALMAVATPVRLRVLVPAVDNAISGLAMRPRDIVRTRAGKTVEVGFTDAEGRLVLCDALTEACSEQPDLVIDVATLTGSAKAALGSELQALFSDDDELAEALVRIGFEVGDPLWRLPIWRPYRRRIDAALADLGNVAKGLFADAIVATLFLSEFVPRNQRWAHLDIMGMNSLARPGRPEGGEATGLLTLYTFLRRRYGASTPVRPT
jgi:leucyl aminopeptidase